MAEFFADRYVDMRLLVPHERGGALSALYASGAPITAREDVPDGVLVTARLPARMVGRTASTRVRRETGARRPASPGRPHASRRVLGRRRARPVQHRASDARARRAAHRGHRIGGGDPAGYAGFVQPRSGLAAKRGITVVNSPGLIDAGYRGELRVVLLNTDPVEEFAVEVGDRIAQLVILAVPEVRLVEVDELPGTERSASGFGSSAVSSP